MSLDPPVAPGHGRHLVVVGAGLAGARTVAAARELGWPGPVTVLGAEGVEPYDRPPLSKELFTRPAPALLREEVGADVRLADEVRLDEPATGLDPWRSNDPSGGAGRLTVRTATGEVHADAVVLATGARAVHPAGWPVVCLRTHADAVALRSSLTPGTRLTVLGAGWIGAEVAGVAAAAGVRVTVVEAAPAPLATALGARVGALTAPWFARAGIDLLTGARAVTVDRDGVVLGDGSLVEHDVVLAALGARPDSDWLAGSLPLADGGWVDVGPDWLVPGTGGRVAAVGDLARRTSPRHGVVPGGHWDAALRGPTSAVRALLRPGGVPDDPAPSVFSTQLGHDLVLVGQPGALDDVVLRGDPAGPFGVVWFSPGRDAVTAVLAVDRPRDAGAARRLFTGPGLPELDRAAAADPDAPLRAAGRGTI